MLPDITVTTCQPSSRGTANNADDHDRLYRDGHGSTGPAHVRHLFSFTLSIAVRPGVIV
jgi:hypothetical protein